MRSQTTIPRWVMIIGAIVVGLAVLYLILMIAMPKAEPRDALSAHSLQVIAHQGGNHLRPGDTLEAFHHAVDLGVDALEMDIHGTADGVLVVIHDDTVNRTTDGSGAVNQKTLFEIKTLDAAYNWPLHEDSDEHPYRGTGIQIPTLEEVLTAFPDMPMIMEIKQAEPPIVDDFGEMLRRHDRVGNTIVASFHSDVMKEFRDRFPEFATSGVEPEIRTFFVLNKIFLGRLYPPPMQAFQVPEQFGNLKVITPRFVRVAQNRGIAVQVWTVNEAEAMRRILDSGVDGIITDRPDRLLQLLGR